MPTWFSTPPDYALLRRCTEQARATMTNWSGGSAKFETVLKRRAWKFYHLNRK